VKQLHRSDLFAWSQFDSQRNIDFHSLFWKRPDGNLVIDPLPASEHDLAHMAALGGVATIVISNSDHVRDAAALAQRFAATVAGPRAEQAGFPLPCARWLGDGDEVVPGLVALALDGSKTPGELALLIAGDTLVTGDLVRCHRGGTLCLLPDDKLRDRAAAVRSVARLAALPGIEAVLPGDGWPVFRGGAAALQELVAGLRTCGQAGSPAR
jgi:glyoxylase-like metal-dependent hydrolase (beta-lactamase superfamily II)